MKWLSMDLYGYEETGELDSLDNPVKELVKIATVKARKSPYKSTLQREVSKREVSKAETALITTAHLSLLKEASKVEIDGKLYKILSWGNLQRFRSLMVEGYYV